MKAAVIGLGVMGGSFAARLKELGHEVIGIDINQDTLDFALEKGLIDQGARDGSPLETCDLVIVCLYPTLIRSWLEENQAFFKPGSLVLEISGVKSPLSALHDSLREDVELVHIHPMCGRESQGIAFSTPRIFDGANFLIIPDERNNAQSLEWTRNFARDLGCKNINLLSAAEHDEMIAFLSQLTHVIAVCLMNTHENEHLVEYSGDSFRELTRIAKINETMWSELFLLNKDVLLEEISAFENSLAGFKNALENGDTKAMKEAFLLSTKRRKAFDPRTEENTEENGKE